MGCRLDGYVGDGRESVAATRLAQRIESAQAGNFGDCGPVGEGVSEMRIHVGTGYRVYYMRIGNTIYLLLAGGAKSTQKRDIRCALTVKKGRSTCRGDAGCAFARKTKQRWLISGLA